MDGAAQVRLPTSNHSDQCRHISHTKTPSHRILRCPACSWPFRLLAPLLNRPVTGDPPQKRRQVVSFTILTPGLLIVHIVHIQPPRVLQFRRKSSLWVATRFLNLLYCWTVHLQKHQCPYCQGSRPQKIDRWKRLLSIPRLILPLLMMGFLMAILTISLTFSRTCPRTCLPTRHKVFMSLVFFVFRHNPFLWQFQAHRLLNPRRPTSFPQTDRHASMTDGMLVRSLTWLTLILDLGQMPATSRKVFWMRTYGKSWIEPPKNARPTHLMRHTWYLKGWPRESIAPGKSPHRFPDLISYII